MDRSGASALHAGPPRVVRPHNAIAKRADGFKPKGIKRGYIFGVSPDNIRPTTCSIIIDNKPPLAGFSLPHGVGPILPDGTFQYQNRDFFGPFTVNPDTLSGGTQVLVDLDSMAVVEILNSPSGTDYNDTAIQNKTFGYVPSKGEVLVGTHTHTGTTDADGHIMPSPIDRPQLLTMPSAIVTSGPTLSTSSFTPLTYASGGPLLPLSISFTQTDFGSLPTWLESIVLRVRKNGGTDWRLEWKVDPKLMTYGSGNGTLNKNVAFDIGATIDIGIAYRDYSGQVSATVWPSPLVAITDPNGGFVQATGTIYRARMDPSFTTAINADGSLANGIHVTNSSGPTIASGSGAPTGSAPNGSIYIRNDGSAANNTLWYVYDSTTSSWKAVPMFWTT